MFPKKILTCLGKIWNVWGLIPIYSYYKNKSKRFIYHNTFGEKSNGIILFVKNFIVFSLINMRNKIEKYKNLKIPKKIIFQR